MYAYISLNLVGGVSPGSAPGVRHRDSTELQQKQLTCKNYASARFCVFEGMRE